MIECMRTEATRKTVTEQRWIPVKYHELTEEERKECLFSADIKYMLDCELPDDEQEIIVTDGRHVWVDTCIVNDGYALDSGHDWIEDVVAWMPLPEPYREVFMWRVFADLSYKQIGDIFSKTDNWACVTYHRARKMIKNRLEDSSYEE